MKGRFNLTRLGWHAVCGVFAVFASSALMLTAHAPAAHAQTYKYDEVVVKGNLRIDKDSMLRFADLPPAGRASADDLGTAYRRLADAALFESLEIRPEGSVLVIEVTEFPVINKLAIEGNKRISDEQLFPLIRSAPRRVYLPAQAIQDAAAIAGQYRIAGRFAADVSPKIIRRSGNRVDLVFEVIEGQVVETERISFVGNRAFSESRLRRELASTEAGFLRTFIKSDTYVQERIAVDRERLTEFYTSRGYVDFEILAVTAETTPERDAFFIQFTVREGPQYFLGDVTAQSEVPGVDADEYLREFRGKSGRVFSPAAVLDGVRRMEFLAVSRNLRFVFVEPQERVNVENQTVDLNFRIHRGSRIFVERIDITGNTTTLDRVIRRQFRIAEGDPFNKREISDAATRIRNLGYFSDVSVNSEQGSSPNQVVVKVKVEEQPTGALSFGAAWSQDEGVAGKISLSQRNLLGRGQTLSLSLETGKSASYSLLFSEPQFLDRDVALTLSTSLSTTRGLGQRYNTESLQFAGRLTFPVSNKSRLSVGGGFSTFRFDNVSSVSEIIRDDIGRGPADKVFVNYSLNFDSRRTSFNPDTGFVLDVGQEIGQGTRDDSTVLTTTASLGGQTRALGGNVTLTGELEGGAALALQGNSRVRDRFRMNSGIMRGFASNGVGPRDFLLETAGDGNSALSKTYLDPLGGNYFTALRLESEFPLGLPQEIGLTGGLFYDVGSVWGLDDKRCANHYEPNQSAAGTGGNSSIYPDPDQNADIMSACVVDDSFRLRSAVGISLFWKSVFGPLRMNFSRPLQYESYDRRQTFDLTLASRF